MKRLFVSITALCLSVACSAAVNPAAAKAVPAATPAPAANSDDATLQRMADETGFSKSVLKSLTAKISFLSQTDIRYYIAFILIIIAVYSMIAFLWVYILFRELFR